MTTAKAVGAASSEAVEWYAIEWPTIQRNVRRLQVRIAQATKVGRWGKVRALQRLLTHSYSGKVLAVRRVTENDGDRLERPRWPNSQLIADYSVSNGRLEIPQACQNHARW